MENNRKNQSSWVLDPAHSELTFKVKHLMISNVKGEFKNFTAELDNEDFKKASIKVTIESAFLTLDNRFEAIISNNDEMALGAIETLQKHGFKETAPGAYDLRDWDGIRSWAVDLATKSRE